MKIVAVSDNHGSRAELNEIKRRHGNEIDLWVHCGDSEFTNEDPLLKQFKKVKGNMDFNNSFPNEVLDDSSEVPVFITHGHLYNVKMSFLNLYYRAEELGAKIVFFGHSHVVTHFQKGGITFVNPGSISLPRGRRDKTYVICEINTSEGNLDIIYYNHLGEVLTDLTSSYKL